MKNSVQLGHQANFTPTVEDIAGGDLITVGAIAGVVVADTKIGNLGALSTHGVFELPSATDFVMGDKVMVADAAYSRNAALVADDGNGVSVGVVFETLPAGSGLVRVKLVG